MAIAKFSARILKIILNCPHNGPERSLGFFKYIIHHWSYIYCWQVVSYTSLEQLKMKLCTWGIKINHIFDWGTFWGSNHPPKVTLVVWLVCHSNSKLAFRLLVTIIYLSSLTVLSPSKDTKIYLRHMIATKKLDLGTFGGSNHPPKVTLVSPH